MTLTELSLAVGLKAFIRTEQEVGTYRHRVVNAPWSKEAADTYRSYIKGDLSWMGKKYMGLENAKESNCLR